MRINRQRIYYSVPKRIFRKIIIVLLVIGIPVMIFLFSFSIKKADVVGSARYSDKQMRQLIFQSPLDYNSAYLYLKYRFAGKQDIPFIEKLDVEITGNHKVTIFVYEKMVIGCVEFMGEYLYFDKDGIVVESSSKKIEKVPVINGLQFDQIILHKKLKVLNNKSLKEDKVQNKVQEKADTQNEVQKEEVDQSDALYQVILNLTQLIHKYKLDVDTINFNDKNEVTLQCNDIRVLLGKKDNYDIALSDLKNILIKAKGTDLYELDMREYDKDSNYVIGKSKKSTK